MTYNFTQPSGGDWFKPAEHPGNLILITKVHEIGTKYDNMAARDKDFAVIDFVDLDEPNPQLRQHVSDNHPGIVNKLAKSFRTGELVLGRINQIPSDKGNPAWILGPFVPGADDARAGAWMTANPLNSFGQPANRPAAQAPAQQYAPPPQPVQQQQYAPQPQQQDPQGFGQYTNPQTQQQPPAPQPYAPAPVPQPVQQQPQYAPAAPAPAQQQYAPQPQAPAQQYQQAPQAPAPQYAPAPQQQYAQQPQAPAQQQPQQGPPPAYDPNNLPPGVADLVNQLSQQQQPQQ